MLISTSDVRDVDGSKGCNEGVVDWVRRESRDIEERDHTNIGWRHLAWFVSDVVRCVGIAWNAIDCQSCNQNQPHATNQHSWKATAAAEGKENPRARMRREL